MASKLKKEDINVLYIYYCIPLDSYKIRIPYVNCSNNNEMQCIFENNKQYRIMLVCKTEQIQQLIDAVSSHYIHRIFTLGDGTGLNIKNKEVTVVNTNERDLMLDILCSAVGYTHDEQIEQQKLQNNRVADERIENVFQLLDQIENLYFHHT